jgi:hypothetical protein
MGASPPPTIDLEGLGLDQGGHLLVERALRALAPGGTLTVEGTHPHLGLHLASWCRSEGHGLSGRTVTKGRASVDRWRGAVRAGTATTPAHDADPTWGFAARGALVEAGGPSLVTELNERDLVWTDLAPKLYAQAAAGQWDPETAIDWTGGTTGASASPPPLPDEVEDAVVQVMTYLVENEQVALAVPAKHLARIHPHYRETIAFLATQVADEARHVEVFTRRAQLHRDVLGSSTVGGRASLQTLVDEPDFTLAAFLLTVLGEGTFLDLLSFLERHGPDAVTRRIAHLARQDEARHVAFGQAHLEHRVAVEPGLRARLRLAVERRHETLRATAGLNAEVHDALVLLAAGAFTPSAVARGWERVQELEAVMREGRRRRLVRLGFDPVDADELAALHTRNFM